MAAAAVAVVQPIVGSIGRGWFFTGLGIWSGICGVGVLWLMRNRCMGWRQGRIRRERERERERERQRAEGGGKGEECRRKKG